MEEESDSSSSESSESEEVEEGPDNKLGSSPPSGKAERDLIIDEPDVTSSPVHNPFAPEATVRSKKKKNKSHKKKNKSHKKKAPKENGAEGDAGDGAESSKKKVKKHRKKHTVPFSLQSQIMKNAAMTIHSRKDPNNSNQDEGDYFDDTSSVHFFNKRAKADPHATGGFGNQSLMLQSMKSFASNHTAKFR